MYGKDFIRQASAQSHIAHQSQDFIRYFFSYPPSPFCLLCICGNQVYLWMQFVHHRYGHQSSVRLCTDRTPGEQAGEGLQDPSRCVPHIKKRKGGREGEGERQMGNAVASGFGPCRHPALSQKYALTPTLTLPVYHAIGEIMPSADLLDRPHPVLQAACSSTCLGQTTLGKLSNGPGLLLQPGRSRYVLMLAAFAAALTIFFPPARGSTC